MTDSVGPDSSNRMSSSLVRSSTSQDGVSENSNCPYCNCDRSLPREKFMLFDAAEKNHDKAKGIEIEHLKMGASQMCSCCDLLIDAIETYLGGNISTKGSEICFRLVREITALGLEFVEPISVDLRPQYGRMTYNFWGRLHIFRPESSVLPAPVRSPRTLALLPEDTSSTQTMLTLNGWILECDSNHEFCLRWAEKSVPFRILRLTDSNVCLEEGRDRKLRYACLSHCWGSKGPSLKLTKDSADYIKKGISISDLPKTFADAARVCLSVDIQFLWIDALCILQDSNDDWQKAAAIMGDIYEGSVLTIAATSSGDSDTGLFSENDNYTQQKQLKDPAFWVREEQVPDFPRPSSNLGVNMPANYPLLRRAWFYQERKLSPRMVHFGKQQIYWECKSRSLSQDGLFAEDRVPHLSQTLNPYSGQVSYIDDVEQGGPSWPQIVQEYALLDLTYDSDRLPAMAAIAKRLMGFRKNDTYIAGMWKNSLLQDLGWRCIGLGRSPRPKIRVPSWSWAATKDRLVFAKYEVLPTVKLLDLSFTRIGPPQNGDTKDAVIKIQAPVAEAIWDQKPLDVYRNMGLLTFVNTTNGTFTKCFYLDFDPRLEERLVPPDRPLLVMFIGQSTKRGQEYKGLALVKVSDTKYVRIGSVTVSSWLTWCDYAQGNFVEDDHVRIINQLNNFITSLPLKEVQII